jgi:hypothetical protein
MKGVWASLVLSLLLAAAQPSADEIIKKSVARTKADWQAAPQFDFMERDVIAKKGRSVKTFRVTMIAGSPYNELVSIDGKPLSPAEAAQETEKLRTEIAKRQHETPAERQKRVAQYDRERRQDNALLEQMVEALDYRLVGEDTVDGRSCYVLEGTPKPGYRPPTRESRVLTGMRGKLWIDARQYQWVKVEAEVFRPVAFGLFIAHVEPGTQFLLEQKPVPGGLWLPSHFAVQVKSKVLGWSRNSSVEETYWNYHRASEGERARASSAR